MYPTNNMNSKKLTLNEKLKPEFELMTIWYFVTLKVANLITGHVLGHRAPDAGNVLASLAFSFAEVAANPLTSFLRGEVKIINESLSMLPVTFPPQKAQNYSTVWDWRNWIFSVDMGSHRVHAYRIHLSCLPSLIRSRRYSVSQQNIRARLIDRYRFSAHNKGDVRTSNYPTVTRCALKSL